MARDSIEVARRELGSFLLAVARGRALSLAVGSAGRGRGGEARMQDPENPVPDQDV